ncbi:hypothetical protein TNCV_3005301 [Trichonephila clavipes]|nr:hypothetical protein TNCV_3005301 [Trichonephila clavipes]
MVSEKSVAIKVYNKIKEFYWFTSMKRIYQFAGKQIGPLLLIKPERQPLVVIYLNHLGPFLRPKIVTALILFSYMYICSQEPLVQTLLVVDNARPHMPSAIEELLVNKDICGIFQCASLI